MSFSNFKETAIEYVKKAVAEDTEGNYEAAYKLYVTALEYFKTVRREVKGGERRRRKRLARSGASALTCRRGGCQPAPAPAAPAPPRPTATARSPAPWRPPGPSIESGCRMSGVLGARRGEESNLRSKGLRARVAAWPLSLSLQPPNPLRFPAVTTPQQDLDTSLMGRMGGTLCVSRAAEKRAAGYNTQRGASKRPQRPSAASAACRALWPVPVADAGADVRVA